MTDVALVGVYSGGRLVSVNMADVVLQESENSKTVPVEVTVPAGTENFELKVMLVDDMNTLKPLASVY